MNILFTLKGTKPDQASIYVRISDTNFDAITSTKLKIHPTNFKKGTIRPNKIPTNCSAEEKQLILDQNKDLQNLEKKLNEIKKRITTAYNDIQDYEIINLEWLKRILFPVKTNELPNRLDQYFDYYVEFKKKTLTTSTLKRYTNVQKLVKAFQKNKKPVFIQEVDQTFSFAFQKWCDKQGYAHNTKVKTIKIIKTICKHASENNIPTNSQLNNITKNLTYKNVESVYLTIEEIQKIINTKIDDPKLDIARDWLVISCYTAQRVSDNLYFKKENIIDQDGVKLLPIKQKKTDTPVYVVLFDEVLNILKKRNGEFPPIFLENNSSNEVIYNRLIKEVCKNAGITQKVTTTLKNKYTNRNEIVEVPKYKAVSSHIGRRSFATNYYGKIDLPLLIAQTGHKTEKQFLEYVGKTGTQNAMRLAKQMKEFSRQMKLMDQEIKPNLNII